MSISLEELRRCTVAVDVGASRTRVYIKGVGLLVDEPSAAAINSRTGALIAVGAQAEQMTGRTPAHVTVVRPVNSSGIIDIETTQRMLRYLLDVRVRRSWRFNPSLRAAACVPHDAPPLAQRAVIDTMAGLGARRVLLVDTLISAAVGCGLPVGKPEGMLIVLTGATMTQVAVVSLGNVVAAEKIPVGGDAVDRALVEHLRSRHELMLRSHQVHSVHQLLGEAHAEGNEEAEVQGRDVVTGLRRTVSVNTSGVKSAAGAPMLAVLDGIRSVLRQCPPELVSDIGERGVMLAGGNATMPGLEAMVQEATGLPVVIADRPDTCSVIGLGAMIESDAKWSLMDYQRPSEPGSDAGSGGSSGGGLSEQVTPEHEPSRPGWQRAARALGVGRERAGAESG